MNYRVHWEIDLEAESPKEAAALARKWLLEGVSTCCVFDVENDQGELQLVDLMRE